MNTNIVLMKANTIAAAKFNFLYGEFRLRSLSEAQHTNRMHICELRNS